VGIPVGAAVVADEPQAAVVAAEVPSENAQASPQVGTYSDASLAGTGAAFLLLGIGTVSVAHRRRWRTIDVRERTLDIRDGAGKQAHA
jgi:hypothetical protein